MFRAATYQMHDGCDFLKVFQLVTKSNGHPPPCGVEVWGMRACRVQTSVPCYALTCTLRSPQGTSYKRTVSRSSAVTRDGATAGEEHMVPQAPGKST